MVRLKKSWWLMLIPIVLATAIGLIINQILLSNQDQVNLWLSSFGPYLLVAYVILQSVTVIIAPIGGAFLQIALLAILEPAQALLIIYSVVTPLYFVNFYIARRYGRPLVQKLVGKQALTTIDHYAKDAGAITLILLRIFQSGIYDYLAYAIGLSNVSLKLFFNVTVFGAIPALMLQYLIFSKIKNFGLAVGVLYLSTVIFALVPFLIRHYYRKHKNI